MGIADRIEKRKRDLERRFPRSVTWLPQPGPQELAYHHPAKILGYGGQPGGGKTDLAIGLALTKHRRSLLLRRRETDLIAIRTRVGELIGRDKVPLSLTVRSGNRDRFLQMGGCAYEASKDKYQGQAHDLKIFDETPQFSPSQVEYISRWCRTPEPGQRCRILYTFNPPETTAGLWINSFFAPWLNPRHPYPAQSGEIRYYLDGRELQPDQFDENAIAVSFIFSRTLDNKYYEREYHSFLLGIGGIKNFEDAIEQDYFQLIPLAHVEDSQERWRKRWAAKDYGAKVAIAADVARGGSDRLTVCELYENDFLLLHAYEGRAIADGPTAARAILNHHEGDIPIYIDVVGWGASPYDFLVEWGYPVTGINAAEQSLSTDRSGRVQFINKRAEMGWRLRDALDPGYASNLAIPDRYFNQPTGQLIPSADILQELIVQQWLPVGRGVQLLSKRQLKESLGRSPDFYDAICLLQGVDLSYVSCF